MKEKWCQLEAKRDGCQVADYFKFILVLCWICFFWKSRSSFLFRLFCMNVLPIQSCAVLIHENRLQPGDLTTESGDLHASKPSESVQKQAVESELTHPHASGKTWRFMATVVTQLPTTDSQTKILQCILQQWCFVLLAIPSWKWKQKVIHWPGAAWKRCTQNATADLLQLSGEQLW